MSQISNRSLRKSLTSASERFRFRFFGPRSHCLHNNTTPNWSPLKTLIYARNANGNATSNANCGDGQRLDFVVDLGIPAPGGLRDGSPEKHREDDSSSQLRLQINEATSEGAHAQH
ncbi:uncharacterized protein LOC123037434 [Drosophila rhopaloa]|uniref:Uncharacterized protein n=1 Tax=Drosophila rhopaloa TaxID=1041015 RepID=A0ABM5J594_DRORH|nr:uncharacterized protein LOC123037434 [Drosophila rhopaloa]